MIEKEFRTLKQDKIIIYNSSDFSHSPYFKIRVLRKDKVSGSQNILLKEMEFVPENIKIYDMTEYLECVAEFKNENITEDKYNPRYLSDFTDIGDLMEKFPNSWVWTTTDIILNENYKDVYFHLDTFEDFRGYTTGKTDTLLFCSPAKYAYITTDGGNSSFLAYDNIEKVVNYNCLTEEEKEFAVTSARKHNGLEVSSQKNNKFKSIMGSVFTKSPEKALKQQTTNIINSLNMTEQELKIFDPSMLNISVGVSNPEAELNKLIGLENVKTEIKKLRAKLLYRNKQKERGIYIENESSMHMCFTGAPGTGKTTVARIITGLLYDMGYIKENKCVEINGQNLKGGYSGQTAIITKLVMKAAKNKVLFIDEAYALFDGYSQGFGKEAIAVILKQMEDERDSTIVIFAGYKNEMEDFLTMNDGLKSRINRYIDFKNYNLDEMTEIFLSVLRKKKLFITPEALEKCMIVFKKASLSPRFSNARFARNLEEKIEYKHASNTYNIINKLRQDSITEEDISDRAVEELLTHSM